MSNLIPKHGGYRNLKSFQIARLVYDVTVRFCELYVDRFSRTRDQMVQAARSGVQNIAEGSQASATSKKTELKLTNVARASLEELKLDYEDYLRQRGIELLKFDHPILVRFKQKRCNTPQDVQSWVKEERRIGKNMLNSGHGQTRTGKDVQSATTKTVSVSVDPCQSVPLSSAALVANAALSLLNLACYLLSRQIETLAKEFENEGGFTERLYRVRTAKRRQHHGY
jgi:four helix bundle suffix protein